MSKMMMGIRAELWYAIILNVLRVLLLWFSTLIRTLTGAFNGRFQVP